MRSLLTTFVLLAFACPTWAQECDTSEFELSMPTERYLDNQDGTVTDTRTGSIWMRCSLGQEWNGRTCTGIATLYTWAEIETLADEVNLDGYAGHDDWRLPNVPEMATITERQCKFPRTNEAVFPATPSVGYWTTMTKPMTELVYVMDFGDKGVEGKEKSYRGPVRMIRGARWWRPPSVREMMKQESK